MLTAWTSRIVAMGDLLLGWSLALSRDVTLLLLALLITGIMLVMRSLCADRARLRTIADDERQLRQLRRQARAGHDREALQRLSHVRRRIAWQRVKSEVPCALISAGPLLLLITWGAQRLEFRPTLPGEPVRLTALLPVSTVDDVTHLVPEAAISVAGGWVRQIEVAPLSESTRGVAEWVLQVQEPEVSLPLQVRFRDETLTHPLSVGQRTYEPARVEHGTDRTTLIALREYRPLGVVPAIGWLHLPAWLVGLMALTLILFFVGKRLMGWP